MALDQLAQHRLVGAAAWRSRPLPRRRARFPPLPARPRRAPARARPSTVLQRVRERAVLVVDIGDAAAHAGGEVAPGAPQHDDGAAGHVFAAVIAGAFDHRRGARIAHAEALAGDAAEIGLAVDRAVHHRVADDDVVLGLRRARGIRIDDDASAGQSLADIIVGRTLQLERDAAREERAEALAGDAVERDVDRVVGQALRDRSVRATAPDSIAPTERLRIADRVVRAAPAACCRAPACAPRSAGDRAPGEAMILLLAVVARDVRRHRRLVEHAREIQAARLPVLDARAHVEQIGAADQFVEPADARASPSSRALPRRRRRNN